MRCPKCGFISFDHLTSCAKCGKDIAEVASELQGTSIKVETPMFLSGALGAFADREQSFEEQAMEAEVDEGIDFSMEDEAAYEEPVRMAETEAEVDFSFADDEGDASIRQNDTAAEESASPAGKAAGAVDFTLEAEAEEEAAPREVEEAIEELDLMGTVDDEEEGSLEFDLEDFLEDMDEDDSKSSGDADIDLSADDEER